MRIKCNICNRRNKPPILDDSRWVGGEDTVILLEVNGKKEVCPKFLPVTDKEKHNYNKSSL